MPQPNQHPLSLIEVQFPIAKLSAEAYKERKAGASQTLTGLGKWWGRKPLVLVRATILGLLLPASDDPHKDRDILLKLMTMDDEGLWQRKDKSIPRSVVLEELRKLPPSIQRRYLVPDPVSEPQALYSAHPVLSDTLRPLSAEERQALQRLVFERLPYSEKLRYCRRPEQIEGPSPKAWQAINAHLGTHATALPTLVQELGRRRFGHRPRVGDAFCGGGSVPFEAARLGCDAYGSDLNPVAALLTWAALHIVGGGEEVARQVQAAQEEVFRTVDAQITAWGIEHNELGWRADAYLYCTEVVCPECGWRVPLAPSWVIAEKTNVVGELVPDEAGSRYEIEVHERVSRERLQRARSTTGTVRESRLHCPHCERSTPIEVLRRGLRPWENDDLTPRPDDVFQERLYGIRWVETYYERRHGTRVVEELTQEQAEALPNLEALLADGTLKERIRRHYCAPTPHDLEREVRALALLRERFRDWQEKGYIPSRRIEPGDETARLQRERGWSYWHHLFTPRQLLIHGQLLLIGLSLAGAEPVSVAWYLAVARCADWDSKLSRVDPHPNNAKNIGEVFSNQALNTLISYAGGGFLQLRASATLRYKCADLASTTSIVQPTDARIVGQDCDYWLTDPPYADAVNYHELSEYFLAWYEKHLPHLFPGWYADSKRALAIRGDDPVAFRQGMVAAYRSLAEHMPDDGMQVVMFTHQDAAVWADLTMILWAAGLRVTAAWTIATETDSSLKQGNYVQGTVLMICRKRTATEPAFLDELVPRIELEVKRQVDAMQALDDDSDPNFGDADYQLAAYAAALRVLTAQPIEDIDPLREINRVRPPGEEGLVERQIRNAVRIACDHLVPKGVDRHYWRTLSPMERFYLKGLEVEAHGEYRNGVYQELARGFGAVAYTDLLADTTANETRLMTPGEFGRRMLGCEGFGGSLLRHVLFAVYQAEVTEEVRRGRDYLKTELPDYWASREKVIHLLDYLAALRRVSGMERWRAAAEYAGMLSALVRDDST